MARSGAITKLTRSGPVVEQLTRRKWRVHRPWTFTDPGFSITVPEGFITDRASIPRVLWGLIDPDDLLTGGSVLHDFLYQNGGKPPAFAVYPADRTFTRGEVDKLFLVEMLAEDVTKLRAYAAWLGVRLFGRFAWQRR